MKEEILAFKEKATSLKISGSKKKSCVTWELMENTTILFL